MICKMRVAAVTAAAMAVPLAGALADPLTFNPVNAFIDNDGANTVGITSGQNITVIVGNVNPNVGTVMTATQGGTTIPLNSLFTSTGLATSPHFAGEIAQASGLTGSWQIVGTQLAGDESTVTATTNNLIGVPVLDRPSNLQVNTPTNTGSLSPTISWNNPAGTFNVNYVEVWSDTTNTRILTQNCAGNAFTCTSIQLPEGLLAPNGDYSVRVLAENRTTQSNFFTTRSRSNSFVNLTATSTDREAGDIRTFDQSGDTGAVITAGANNLVDHSVHIGQSNGPGAVTIDSGSSLTTSFLNVGRNANHRGNLLVDGGTITLEGSNEFGPGDGGFMNVGRAGNGFAEFINGATVNINATGFNTPGFQLGRDSGSFGQVVVDGNTTTVTIDGTTAPGSGSEKGFLRVGGAGTGRLDIRNGAVVSNDPNGRSVIGNSSAGPGRGAVVVDGATSIFNAGNELIIGGNNGEGLLQLRNGGTAMANTINVFDGGVISGIGTVTGNVNVFAGGFVQPGLSPGILVIDGDLVLDEGVLLLEANSLSEIDQIVVNGNAVFNGGTIEILLGFTPAPTDVLNFFDVQGSITISQNFGGIDVFAPTGSGVPKGSQVNVQVGNQSFTETVQFADVPEPGTLAILPLGLAALAYARRRRLRSRASRAT